jgi:hypothetical protein
MANRGKAEQRNGKDDGLCGYSFRVDYDLCNCYEERRIFKKKGWK